MNALQAIGSGIGESIRQAVPWRLVPVFIAITRLGNVALFFVLFTLDYWLGDHERGAHALSLALGGLALVTVLKTLFAEPRPPETTWVIETGGFGFPSGHATTATIGWGCSHTTSRSAHGIRDMRSPPPSSYWSPSRASCWASTSSAMSL